ncbi:MAG: TonB family protein [Betaproteobacteria bacterium]|nr:TonB family protein [Betaproteobacteria bacterium]
MFSRSFLFALAASVVLHLALIASGLLGRKVSPHDTPASISARLLPPATVRPQEALLKDTMAEPETAKAVQPPPKPVEGSRRRPAPRTPEEAAQRKLSEVLFYPPEAVARGIEGEVRLLLTLDRDGRLLDAQVAAGSGHRMLDEAAVKAAFAMGSLPEAGAREVILPVVFRLR